MEENGIHLGAGNWFSDIRNRWMFHWEYWRSGRKLGSGDSVSERGARDMAVRFIKKLYKKRK